MKKIGWRKVFDLYLDIQLGKLQHKRPFLPRQTRQDGGSEEPAQGASSPPCVTASLLIRI